MSRPRRTGSSPRSRPATLSWSGPLFPDDADGDLIARRRSTHHRLGFALQMWTVRCIGRFFPDDPLDAPWPVVGHLAAQLGTEEASVVKRDTERPKTAYEHACEIRDAYEYHARDPHRPEPDEDEEGGE